jgi:hypothetical protein
VTIQQTAPEASIEIISTSTRQLLAFFFFFSLVSQKIYPVNSLELQ